MKETQHSISTWAVSTFGPGGLPIGTVVRALKEMLELTEITANAPDLDHPKVTERIAEEAADVAVVLLRLSERFGIQDLSRCSCSPPETLENRDDVLTLVTGTLVHVARIADGLSLGYRAEAFEPTLTQAYAALSEICRCVGRDLGAAIDTKMIINRSREWVLDGKGQGQHRPGIEQKAGGEPK